MYAGIAGGLLVFTGIWHATEWMMDGRRRDTWRLVPVGLIYIVFGCLVVAQLGGVMAQFVALGLALLGGAVAFVRRDQFDLRKWVIWTFICIDVVIVLSLAIAMIL